MEWWLGVAPVHSCALSVKKKKKKHSMFLVISVDLCVRVGYCKARSVHCVQLRWCTAMYSVIQRTETKVHNARFQQPLSLWLHLAGHLSLTGQHSLHPVTAWDTLTSPVWLPACVWTVGGNWISQIFFFFFWWWGPWICPVTCTYCANALPESQQHVSFNFDC